MIVQIKNILREILPPFVARLGVYSLNSIYGWHGDYKTWEEAKQDSSGYDSDIILAKVRDALHKVKRGEATYEQDSVLYRDIVYPWPILSGLLRAASQNNNRLTVLDFGGSLGSSYFQNKSFLSGLTELNWLVVEQKHYVDCGKKEFEDDQLRFYYDIETCLENEYVDVALFSSVLAYIENPYEVLDKTISSGINTIILDRIPLLLSGDRDKIKVQKVRPTIYKATYPAWFFNKKKFLGFIQKRYRIVTTFECDVRPNIKSEFKGFILEKNK